MAHLAVGVVTNKSENAPIIKTKIIKGTAPNEESLIILAPQAVIIVPMLVSLKTAIS